MKILKMLFFSMVIALLSLSVQAQTKNEKSIQIKTSAVCGMCKATIEKAVASETGVKSSSLDLDTKVLTIVYNTRKTDAAKLKLAVTNTGYDADELPAQEKAYNNLNACCKKSDTGH